MSVWEQLVGQEAAVDVLAEAALAARRVVDGNLDDPEADTDDARSMTHAWLITGPPG